MLDELPSVEEQQTYQSHPYPHTPVGLAIFSPSFHLLYQNQHAKYLSSLIKGEQVESLSPLTKAFQEIGGEILEGLHQHRRQSTTQLLEKKWITIVDSFTIHFQGIGIRNNQNFSESRIMIRFAIRKGHSKR